MSSSKQIHGLFVLLLLSALPACQGRSEKTTREAGGDRSTVYTRTQGPPPGQSGQTGADSSTPTAAEGGAVGGQGTPGGDGSASTPGPGRQSPTGTTHGATAPSSDTAGRPATAPSGESAGRGSGSPADRAGEQGGGEARGARPSGDMNRERR
ncbi:hypothetical protein K7C98_27195 [Nannocystis pusilla]|uniref:Uncharacterized protein n=1 Tax=Nannocystis pusilla TaxID=889268 RepID=A0ABS7TXF8_9BACT|nr:hypothetical protein [Nannocystis pusilla]